MKNNDTPLPLTLLLGILVALSALGTDFYVPALPDAAASFSAPVSATQLTITAYFAGLAVGQLFWGPLSDRYGRRPVLLLALGGMLVFTAAAPLAPSRVAPTTNNSSLWTRRSSHTLARSSRRRCATEVTMFPFIGI